MSVSILMYLYLRMHVIEGMLVVEGDLSKKIFIFFDPKILACFIFGSIIFRTLPLELTQYFFFSSVSDLLLHL